MTDDQIIDMAIREGFSGASLIDTATITFDTSFRAYCEENLCGQYGANHSCPPYCGTPEEMEEKILQHRKALVLQTVRNVENCQDDMRIESAKRCHREYFFKVIERLERQGLRGLPVGVSYCSLCTPCAIREGKPCSFPERRYSCMSAYCIDVKNLAEQCGMDYDYKDGVLPLFSLYAFG